LGTAAAVSTLASVPVNRQEVVVFSFDATSERLEGHVLGALERAAGGGVSIGEVLVLLRDAATAELSVLSLRAGDSGAVVRATDFRLDVRRRRETTARVLAAAGEDSALARLADGLAPGAGVVAVAIQHTWLDTLLDGVDRAGGRLCAAEPVGPREHADIAALALAATRAGAAA
jgi:hypothetical protein